MSTFLITLSAALLILAGPWYPSDAPSSIPPQGRVVHSVTNAAASSGRVAAETVGAASPSRKVPITSSVAVTIRNFQFSPNSLTVRRGTTVTWTNMDNAQHTVTRPLESGAQVAGPDSPILNPGDTYSYMYNAVGIFDYHCSIHPSLQGSVVVTQ